MDRKWTENGQNIDKDGSKDGQKMDLDKVEKEHAIGQKWIEKGLNMVRI